MILPGPPPNSLLGSLHEAAWYTLSFLLAESTPSVQLCEWPPMDWKGQNIVYIVVI